MEEVKKCSKCGNEYPLTKEFFFRSKTGRGGWRPRCKECDGYKFGIFVHAAKNGYRFCYKCRRELPLTREYFHVDNRQEFGLGRTCHECRGKPFVMPAKEGFKICNMCGDELPKTHEFFTYADKNRNILESYCRKCLKIKGKENRTKYKSNRDKYYIEHKEELKEYRKKYNEEHKEELSKKNKIYVNNRLQEDVEYRLMFNLRRRINHAVNGCKSNKTFELIGCTSEELIQRLESLFEPWMHWGNYGKYGWVIDHIKPCAAFDLTDPEQQKECFHYSNLQPMKYGDNLYKNSMYNGVYIRKKKPKTIP